MRILNENKQIEKWPKRVVCEYCDTELEIDRDDVFDGVLGLTFVQCPVCKRDFEVDCPELEKTITGENLEFPNHFFNSKNGVDIDKEEILKYIRMGINFCRKDPEAFVWTTELGNTYIAVYNYSGDKNYYVVVSKDYYSTYVPYDERDYNVQKQNDWEWKNKVVRGDKNEVEF